MNILNFKKLLKEESPCPISDELIDSLLNKAKEVKFASGDVLIPYNSLDYNVYFLESGILRFAYLDGDNERTYAFAAPGTMFMSMHSFCAGRPSFIQIEACGEVNVVKITKMDFDKLVDQSHEFTKWMLTLSNMQLWANEMKLSVINGTAKEKFISLLENRPEIMEKVPLKIIASYLGITPEYLSSLKRNLYINKQI